MEANELTCVTSTDRIPNDSLRHAPIDHVLLSDDLAVRCNVVAAWEGAGNGVRLSDHSGLIVEVRPPCDV
jgi:endonuclease/exonuclease/phosphatase family metal-dependent hydrolase